MTTIDFCVSMAKKAPQSEEELLARSRLIEGLTFTQLASRLNLAIPELQKKRKGWIGLAIELALGATAGTKPLPDFHSLGIELKTLPLSAYGKPAESTFVTSIPLLTIHQQQWLTSQCYTKLKRILWVSIEGDTTIPYMHRRIGSCFLWSPGVQDEKILKEDWEELVLMISTGRLDEINASKGEYLQVRPKAAHGKSLCYGFDNQGNKILTLPRGFYLRARFTEQLIKTFLL